MSRTLWLAALTLAFALPAAAQDSFGRLPKRIRAGQTIVVVDARGTEFKGTVQAIDRSKLVVDFGYAAIDPSLQSSYTFAPQDVRRVFKPNRLWDGAITGAAIGSLPLLLMSVAEDCTDCGFSGEVVTGGLIGAGIGVAVDALLGPRTLFRNRHARASHVSVTPVVGRDRKGVAAALRF